jgi:hypothetical protein
VSASRFRPPRVTAPPEVVWAFRRAFALGPVDVAPPPDPAAAVERARDFDLVCRIGARRGLQSLADDLGREQAVRLFGLHAAQRARTDALAGLIAELALDAASARTPVAFLKFAALHLRGAVQPGSRPAGDVDVLVPAPHARALAERLRGRGFRDADVPEHAHQLRPLVDPAGRVLEIHRHVPGLRVRGSTAKATFEALDEVGAFEHVAGLPGDARVPSRGLALAHATAHGLVQSAFAPHTYSPTRLIADAIDLGLGTDAGLPNAAWPWLAGEVPQGDLDALTALCRRLAGGDAAPFDEPDALEGRLLRHVLAGALDPDYRRSLRARGALIRGDGLGSRLREALVLTDAQIDALYGRPRGRWGYALRRAGRPLDLLARLARAAWSSARVHARR